MIFRILCPELPVITPIRDQRLSRDEEIAYLSAHGVDGDWTKAAYSINQGIWGTTVGGKETLTSNLPLPQQAFPSEQRPTARHDHASVVIGFTNGQPTSLDGTSMEPVAAIRALNELGADFGIGRDMHVGDTIIGIKGRVAFEAPAALMLIKAHHALEKHVLTKWQLNLKDQLALWYGQLLHEGQFLDPAMRSIEAFFDDTQRSVNGAVELALSRERFAVQGITSPHDMMSSTVATYGEMNRAFDGEDAKGYATIASISTMLHRSVQS